MAIIPNWAIGLDWTVISVTPQTADSTGTLTDGTVATVTLLARRAQMALINETENLSAMTRSPKNNVPIETDTEFVLELLLKKNDSGALTNSIAAIAAATFYVKIIITRAGKTWTGYAGILRYEEEGTKASGIATLTLGQVDAGGSLNPTYA